MQDLYIRWDMEIVFEGTVWIEGKRVERCVLGEREHVTCMRPDGVTGEISLQNGEVKSTCFEVEQWGGVAVMRAKSEALSVRAVRQAAQEFGGTAYTVTAVCESAYTNVWIDGLSSRLLMLPRGEDAEVDISVELSAAVVAVKRGERRYLALVALYEDEVLYDGWVRDYRLDDRLTVECTYEDMKRHTRTGVYGYIDGKFGLIEQSFTCAYSHTYISALVPYLFAEALAVGNEEEAKDYLTEELKNDFASLKDYVGAVTYVRRPPVACAACDVGLVDASGVGRILSFEMEGDRIKDVRVVESQ